MRLFLSKSLRGRGADALQFPLDSIRDELQSAATATAAVAQSATQTIAV